MASDEFAELRLRATAAAQMYGREVDLQAADRPPDGSRARRTSRHGRTQSCRCKALQAADSCTYKSAMCVSLA